MVDYWPNEKNNIEDSDGNVHLSTGNKYRRRGFGDQSTLDESVEEYNFKNEEAREKFELEKELRRIEKEGGGQKLQSRGQWWT
jgi:hypothetical protein